MNDVVANEEVYQVFPKVNIPKTDDGVIEPKTLFTAVAGTIKSSIDCVVQATGLSATQQDRSVKMEFFAEEGSPEFLSKLRVDFTSAQTTWDLPMPIGWNLSLQKWVPIDLEDESQSKDLSVEEILSDVAGRCVYFIESALDETYDYKNAERDVLFNIINYYKSLPEGIDFASGFAKLFLIQTEAAFKIGMTQDDVASAMQLVASYQGVLQKLDESETVEN